MCTHHQWAWAHMGRPERDELERPPAVGVAVQLLVRPVERLGEIAPEWDGQLEGLPAVAHVGLALGGELAGLLERDDERAHLVPPLVADGQTESREHAGRGGNEDGAELQLVGEGAGMKRASAAEGDEREVARVEAALDRDDAECGEHLCVHDLDHVLGLGAHARQGALRGVAVELETAGEPVGKAAEEQVRVRDRGQLAAAAVARGPGPPPTR